jgi:uncharacterized membrane protein
MKKKARKVVKPSERGREKISEPFTFLGETFDTIDKRTVKRHLFYLVLASLMVKVLVLFATTAVFRSFVDLFDLQYYLQNALLLAQGKVPYLSYSFEYPVLIFIPIVIALIPALATQNGMAFVYSFQLLMVLCDIGTLLCVYFIGLKVWNEKTAWYAGLIYATAFSASYFVLTKYDAFPTLLLMGAVLFTVYDRRIRGYISATLGFFTKIYPAIAFPFMIFYHAKTTSLRQEIISTIKVVVPFFLVLLLPFLILRPASVGTYLVATGSGRDVYANSATYTIYAYLHDILHFGISAENVSLFMYALLGITLLFLLYLAYTSTKTKPQTFLKIILCAVFSLVFFSKLHSPQYILWFTPFLCLLVAGDPGKMMLFYITQIFGYIEFPLIFGSYYINLNYVHPVGEAGWYMTLFFFTLKYLALVALIFIIIRPEEGIGKKMREIISGT